MDDKDPSRSPIMVISAKTCAMPTGERINQYRDEMARNGFAPEALHHAELVLRDFRRFVNQYTEGDLLTVTAAELDRIEELAGSTKTVAGAQVCGVIDRIRGRGRA